MLRRIMAFLEYDEVTLFCLNYSFCLLLLLDFDFLKWMFSVLLSEFFPLVALLLMGAGFGTYHCLVQLWRDTIPSQRIAYLMLFGGINIAVLNATSAILFERDASWFFIAMQAYVLAYNLLMAWFMGLMDGYSAVSAFLSRRQARSEEAIVSVVLVTALATVLSVGLDYAWWAVINACVFYVLSANKLVVYGMELYYERKNRAA